MSEIARIGKFGFVVCPEAQPGDRVRIVVEGQDGYRPTDLDPGVSEPVAMLEAKVATYNARLGVTADEVRAMTLQSMFPRRARR